MPASPLPNYVLVSPARNESKYIQKTLDSVSGQTHHPLRWVIVDDGSTDATPDIVRDYAVRFPWIHLIQRPKHLQRSFAGKVHAFNLGLEQVLPLDFEVLGNLDADLSFPPEYLAVLMSKFAADPQLGVAGTPFLEEGYDSAKDSFEGQNHVAGGCQLFRRRCFEEIGGFVPNHAGGVDWIAVTTARMKGWKTQSFPELRFFHHRSLGTAERSLLASTFSYGEKDYYLGGSPLWQLFRIPYRMLKRPYIVGGLALLAGYLWAAVRRIKRPVSAELMRFHRREQHARLRAILGRILRLKRVDAFRVEEGSAANPKSA